MRLLFGAILAVFSVMMVPGRASAQTSLDGFGALPLNQISSFGDSGVPFDFGGRVGFEVAPGLQLSGEFGRLGNVLPEVVALPLSFAPFDFRVSAFYGEGGARLLAAPRSAVTPYAEASAGIAHLNYGLGGFGSTGNAIALAALNLTDRSHPLVGVGGGVLLRTGPLHVDVGYRYKRILADDVLTSIVSAGQHLQSHQVRFGVGMRF